MTDPSGDPLFQLNAVLWMLQPMPEQPNPVNAVLHLHGYAIRSLGQSLTADAVLERQLAVELDLRGSPAPDVLASAPTGNPWPVFECKGSSFGPDSTTSDQALKILARGADLSLTVGSAPSQTIDGCVVYVTRKEEATQLQATVEELSAILAQAGVSPAPASTLGLRIERGTGLLARVIAGSFPGKGGSALASDVLILRAAGPQEEARPLYLVPFDPGIQQDAEERTRCLRVLLARGQATAASALGRGPSQGTAVLEGHALIDAATYGLAKHWRDTAVRERAAQEILRFVKAALTAMRNPKAPMVMEGGGPKRLEVVIRSDEHRQACADAVMAHPLPAEPELSEFVEQELPFADVEDDESEQS